MKIAVEGCCHGELDKIYETVQMIEERDEIKVDLLLICGDFQAVRNMADLQCMAVPPCYRQLNTFYKYYSGEKKAPVLTIVIGGNHEASNYMQELPYGGWLAPNIYYLGYAGVVKFGGLRIAGLSGIYKGNDYYKGHYEKLPYTDKSVRTVYHVRSVEVFRLKQLEQPIDIFLSHDWPRGIYNYGNIQPLLKWKPHFRKEIEEDSLGSPAAEEILYKVKPKYWFSAHLHCKFAAIVDHKESDDEQDCKETRFLALDKCLPRRQFLQVLDIPHDTNQSLQLELDPEWLAVLKSTNHLFRLSQTNQYMPGPGSTERYDFTVTQEEMNSITEDFGGIFTIPENFAMTADPHQSTDQKNMKYPETFVNPQTALLTEMLGLTDPNSVFTGKASTSVINELLPANPDEIQLDSDESEDTDLPDDVDDLDTSSTVQTPNASLDLSNDILDGDDEESANFASTPNPKSLNLPCPKTMLCFDDSPAKTGSDELEESTSDPPSSQPGNSSQEILSQSTEGSASESQNDSKEEIGSQEAGQNSSTKSADSEQMAPRKKFKRRNQNLYQSSD